MSLLKLPLLVVSSVSFHVALWCPPGADHSGDKIVITSIQERIWRYAGFPSTVFLKAVSFLIAAAESAVIISSNLPQDAPYLSPSPAVSALLNRLGHPEASKLAVSFMVGTLLVTASGIARVLCYRALGPFFTFEQCIRKDHKLVTTGPYAIVRHPSYTALLVCMVGSCMMYASPDSWLRRSGVLSGGGMTWLRPIIGSWWAIVAASCVTLFQRTTDEDRLLLEKFGKEWENWAGRVKYKLAPFVY